MRRWLWSYTAGGRIDTPPTVYGGRLLFGSADGWVSCLRAGDGELVCRLRAAPDDLGIVANDQLESPWPAHGSVVVQGGVACFVADRSSLLDASIHVYAVRPETGEVLRHERIHSIDSETGDMSPCRLPYDMPPDALGALPDVLVGDGDHVFMRHLRFDPSDLSYASVAASPAAKRGACPYLGQHVMSVVGLLDDCWFNQTYGTVDGNGHSKLLALDADAAYGVQPFAGTARRSRTMFRPGTKGYTLFAKDCPGHGKRWSIQVPIRIRAMVLAGWTLQVTGAPGVVDPDEPWSTCEGRKGGRAVGCFHRRRRESLAAPAAGPAGFRRDGHRPRPSLRCHAGRQHRLLRRVRTRARTRTRICVDCSVGNGLCPVP